MESQKQVFIYVGNVDPCVTKRQLYKFKPVRCGIFFGFFFLVVMKDHYNYNYRMQMDKLLQSHMVDFG